MNMSLDDNLLRRGAMNGRNVPDPGYYINAGIAGISETYPDIIINRLEYNFEDAVQCRVTVLKIPPTLNCTATYAEGDYEALRTNRLPTIEDHLRQFSNLNPFGLNLGNYGYLQHSVIHEGKYVLPEDKYHNLLPQKLNFILYDGHQWQAKEVNLAEDISKRAAFFTGFSLPLTIKDGAVVKLSDMVFINDARVIHNLGNFLNIAPGVKFKSLDEMTDFNRILEGIFSKTNPGQRVQLLRSQIYGDNTVDLPIANYLNDLDFASFKQIVNDQLKDFYRIRSNKLQVIAPLPAAICPNVGAGIDNDGNLIVVIADGWQTGYSDGCSIRDFNKIMLEHGVIHGGLCQSGEQAGGALLIKDKLIPISSSADKTTLGAFQETGSHVLRPRSLFIFHNKL